MTHATDMLISELSALIDEHKYLLLTGDTAVGKTFLANEIANRCKQCEFNAQGALSSPNSSYKIEVEIVPIHPSYGYEDFVAGAGITVTGGKVDFHYQDKVFLSYLRRANASWSKGNGSKYFMVLDGIERGLISGILGDMLPLIEPHGNEKYQVTLKDGTKIGIPPNFYLIATKNTTIEQLEPSNYGLLRHFYIRHISNDYRYISDDATAVYTDYDVSANAMFYRTRRIVEENLRYRRQESGAIQSKYNIGHGVFKANAVGYVMKYQVLPTLYQYVKDGILDKSAVAAISSLQRMFDGSYTKDPALGDLKSITGYKKGVTPEFYYNESVTHQPIVNLVCRIKEQGLISDADIVDSILFNKGVLIRKSAGATGAKYPSPAYLYVKRSDRDIYTYTKSNRFLYSAQKKDMLVIKGVEYSAAAEMQPKEYTRWSANLNSSTFENERYSSSPNSIMFRILRGYYGSLCHNLKDYLAEFPEDSNVKLLLAYAEYEFQQFIEFVKSIGSGSDEAQVNLERNRMFREGISKLTLLWKNLGDTILWSGQSIKVEGVYKVNTCETYKEYATAMEELGIHQMILQGPPGTSKTYSARQFLRFVGGNIADGSLLTSEEIDAMQITSYDGESFSEWQKDHPGEKPAIAWEIVQFHPSYGYEDFVRGIDVSTAPSSAGVSTITYETVNKALGKIAALASKPANKNTKFFLIIDEINRANLATVFGELIYGLEYRGQSVATPYTVQNTNKICLPDNLYILGTMNTADKSIGGIDYAIRRRFLFFSLLPDRNVIATYNITDRMDEAERNAQQQINQQALALFDQIEKLFSNDNLNSEYYKDDIQVGHTYFLVKSVDQLYLRFKYQMLPILREYYKDGIFQFDAHENEEDGFNGLINIISGNVNISGNDALVHEIFAKLIEKE